MALCLATEFVKTAKQSGKQPQCYAKKSENKEEEMA